jgi:hypothetical protein
MKQKNQIGKYIKKDDILNSKCNKTFVTPNNKEYTFNYRKEKRSYIFIINYKGYNCQIKESEFNTSNIDDILNSMDKGIEIM